MKGPKLIPKWSRGKLQKEWVKSQAYSVEYGRKLDKMEKPAAAQKKKDLTLIDKGFKAFKKADEYEAYKKKMEEKYA